MVLEEVVPAVLRRHTCRLQMHEAAALYWNFWKLSITFDLKLKHEVSLESRLLVDH